jgi:tetratricopeptide (TPR) repeat protein
VRRAAIALVALVATRAAADPATDRAAGRKKLDECTQALAAKQYETAIAACKDAVRLSDAPRAWYTLGQALVARRDWDDAVDACARAAALVPDEPMYQLWLGVARYEQADAHAREDHARAQGRKPDQITEVDL